MKASECYIGMKVQLVMEWAEWDKETHCAPLATATCIDIPPHKRFGLFQYANGIRETVPLEDETKYPKRRVPDLMEVTQSSAGNKKPENSKIIRDELEANKVPASALSARLKKGQTYVSLKLTRESVTDEEVKLWRKLILTISADRNRPLNPKDRHYLILKALRDTGMTRTEFSRLSGHRGEWLSEKLRTPLGATEEKNIAREIYDIAAKLPNE